MSAELQNPLEAIPPARDVREHLAANMREARLLRQMLKLAEQAERQREQREQREGEK